MRAPARQAVQLGPQTGVQAVPALGKGARGWAGLWGRQHLRNLGDRHDRAPRRPPTSVSTQWGPRSSSCSRTLWKAASQEAL